MRTYCGHCRIDLCGSGHGQNDVTDGYARLNIHEKRKKHENMDREIGCKESRYKICYASISVEIKALFAIPGECR